MLSYIEFVIYFISDFINYVEQARPSDV